MKIRETAEHDARGVVNVLGISPDPDQPRKVAAIVEKAIINTVLETKRPGPGVAVECCSPGKTLAHKISKDQRLATEALIGNLVGLR
jgi:hypothetical protein